MNDASRQQVWLVSPAYQRFAVTRLALAQRASLAGELAGRGIDCHTVIVADDENLDIAREHGCDTVELDNSDLGARFNAGYQHAAREGADWLVHIGSDDWLHPAALEPLTAPLEPRPIIAGRSLAFINLKSGRMRRATLNGPTGAIPWIIPRRFLEPTGFAPIRLGRRRGMDGELVRGLRRAHVNPVFAFHDPHPFARVDFKSDVNINGYDRVPGHQDPPGRNTWAALADHYSPELVELARSTHLDHRRARHAQAQAS